MMKWIEKIHENLNLQLDNLPREIVRACEREGFRQEMKAIKEAEDAARKVNNFYAIVRIHDKKRIKRYFFLIIYKIFLILNFNESILLC